MSIPSLTKSPTDTRASAVPPGYCVRGNTEKAGKKATTLAFLDGTVGSSKEIPPRGTEYTFMNQTIKYRNTPY
jgi:hypothetical protein